MLTPLKFMRNHAFMISICALLIYGWMQRNDNYLSAETGTGYLLGISGVSLMVMLLMYPLSKRVKALTKLIPLRYWFSIHMLFGVVGPVMILFHSNFHLGSMNSSIALVCMLLVAGSGLVGRYIYTHIHHGLFGSRITLKEMKQKTQNNHNELLAIYGVDEKLNQRLTAMEENTLKPRSNIFSGIAYIITLAFNARKIRKNVLQLVQQRAVQTKGNSSADDDSKRIVQTVNHYTLALRRTAAFSVYERLFSLWHVFHLPLFFMMIITAVIHIFAVHTY